MKRQRAVIAATHQNLEDRVRQGLFREDLFHRLNVIRLRLPPLRERTEDIRCWRATSCRRARGTRRRCQALSETRDRVSAGVGVSRQRAPAGEPVPLAHRDGARAGVEVADLPPNARASRRATAAGDGATGSRAGPREAALFAIAPNSASAAVADRRRIEFELRTLIRASARAHRRPPDRGGAAASLSGCGRNTRHDAQDPGARPNRARLAGTALGCSNCWRCLRQSTNSALLERRRPRTRVLQFACVRDRPPDAAGVAGNWLRGGAAA
jgi:two-component system nitrogen regulation response regulator GlnG